MLTTSRRLCSIMAWRASKSTARARVAMSNSSCGVNSAGRRPSRRYMVRMSLDSPSSGSPSSTASRSGAADGGASGDACNASGSVAGLDALRFFMSWRRTRRQVLERIDRPPLAPDLEVQLHTVGIAAAHLGHLLALAHGLVFLDQQRLVVRVGRQIGVVVL